MGWLRLVGCLKMQVSLQNKGLFCRALLQKRPIFLSILLIVATPYQTHISHTTISHISHTTITYCYQSHARTIHPHACTGTSQAQHRHMHRHIHTCTYANIRARACILIYVVHTCPRTVGALKIQLSTKSTGLWYSFLICTRECSCVYIYVYMYICIYVYIYIYLFIHE